MPGLNQLKQLNSDVLNLGNEVKVRSARGEKPVIAPLPQGIPDEDDSEDFRLGLPVADDGTEGVGRDTEDATDPYGDFGMDYAPAPEADEVPELEEAAPNVSDLLSPPQNTSLDDLDLSEFEEPEPEPPLEDMGLDALLKPSGSSTQEESPSQEESAPETEESSVPEEAPAFGDDLDSLIENAPEDNTAPKAEEATLPDFDDFAPPDTEHAIDMNEGLPEDIAEVPAAEEEPLEASPATEDFDIDAVLNNAAQAEEASQDTQPPEDSGSEKDDLFGNLDTDNFDLPEMEDMPDQDVAAAEESASPAFEAESASGEGQNDDDFMNGLLDGLDLPEETAGEAEAKKEAPVTSLSELEEEPVIDFGAKDDGDELEQFDTSGMDDLDFSLPEDDAGGSAEGGTDDDGSFDSFSSNEDEPFHIPGFSDTTGSVDVNKPKPDVATPDFSSAKEASEEKKPKNTFTEAEYKRFRQNLSEYPLNVRIALEDLVVKNEFTDDAVFEVLDKVLRKVPARQLATQLEKLLDISLDVPRDYERRTAAEYEAYKQTIEYKLKNRIIPGAILSAAAVLVAFCIFFLSQNLIYKPLMASKLYKQGYECIAETQYSLSEDYFNRALGYRSVRDWYFKYADRYRDHKQYERARKMYWALIKIYNHDKQAGLAWADMEMSELYNFEEAERILKREVLDFHVNAPEAILALGDNYLAWADSGDSSKYPLAKEQYDLLVNLYGDAKKQDVYLGRLMRYYIRMDDLAQVLQYKDVFYPQKVDVLSADDLTELSGYLLDKRYGDLRPSEQSLRIRIEDVRPLLEAALKKDESNPLALYNLGRYSVFTHTGRAQDIFRSTLEAFEKRTRLSRKDIYTFINTYRLLGEEYVDGQEYIPAQRAYNDGIALFETEHKNGSLEATEDIGKLYADLGDVQYFINGDMEAALNNYTHSVENKNDNASVRYKIGYIQYTNQNLREAQGSFTLGLDSDDKDEHLLLALANTLSLLDSHWAAQGYYERLLGILQTDFEKFKVIMPQVRPDQGDLVEVYMKARNNLGVTLSRLSGLNGDSTLNGKAIVNLQESMRATDALTRNPETMVRLGTSNLAEENLKYLTNPGHGYEPTIYTEIPKMLYGEKGLTQ